MSNSKSFIGEHSIGLSIVPIVKAFLHEKYEFVIPIFPWMTREGTTMSMNLHRNDQFKAFGIYARRPKLNYGNDDIELKINGQVFAGACGGLNLGIPIIAGCPLVKNFWELSENPKFIWIRLDMCKNEDIIFQIKHGVNYSSTLSDILFFEKHEILDYISENSKFLSIKNALMAFKEINRISMNMDFYPRFGFGGVYKPIYFLLK
jgi:hypothetical protein